MSMWLVHIKEHMWSVGTCPTTVLLSTTERVRAKSAVSKGRMIKEVLPHMRCRPVCSPGSWYGRGGSPSRNGMIQYGKWPEQQKYVKHIDSTSMCTLVTALYQVPKCVWSCDTTGAGTGVTWCKHHHQWHHCTFWSRQLTWGATGLSVMWPLGFASHDANSIVNGTIDSLGQDSQMWENVAFLVMWHHWDWHQMMLMASSMASLHSLGQNYKMMCNTTYLVMWCHMHQHDMMLIASSMALLHSLGQADQMKCKMPFLVMWHHWCQCW